MRGGVEIGTPSIPKGRSGGGRAGADDYRYEVSFHDNEPLGIVFAKKKALGAPSGGHLIVKTLKPNKAAARKGVISIGDVVERVNGQTMAPDDVVKVMRSKKRPLRMMLRTRFKPRTRGSAEALLEAKNMVFPALVTPLGASGDVDVASAERLIDSLYDNHGVGGLYVGGTTGEGIYLSAAARRTITEVAVRKSSEGGRTGKVIVHVGAAQSSMAFDLAVHAQGCGADAVSSLPPFVGGASKYSYAEVCDYYRQLCLTTTLPVLAYYIPQLTQRKLSMQELTGIARCVRWLHPLAARCCAALVSPCHASPSLTSSRLSVACLSSPTPHAAFLASQGSNSPGLSCTWCSGSWTRCCDLTRSFSADLIR